MSTHACSGCSQCHQRVRRLLCFCPRQRRVGAPGPGLSEHRALHQRGDFRPRGVRGASLPQCFFCSAAGRAGKAGEEEKAELTRSLQGSVAVTLPLPSCTFPGCSRGRHPSPENSSCPGLGAELLGAAHWVLEGREAASSQCGERTSPGCSQELTGE